MKSILLGLLFCVPFLLHAQRKPLDYKMAVSFNPSLLIGSDYTVMLGAEYRVKEKIGLLLDAGYIFHSSYFEANKIKGASGFNLRPAVRWYGRKGKEFLQLQLFYKHVDYNIYDWLGKNCVNEVPAYEQLQNFIYRKKAVTLNFIVGEMYRLSDDLYIEIYAGLGTKFKSQGPTEPNSCYRNEGGDVGFNMYNEKSVTPNVPMGFKLVYLLKR